MAQPETTLEAVLKRDRAIFIAGIIGLTLISWAYIFYLARDMSGMDIAMAPMRGWSAADFFLMFLMWAVMMVAMMVPTAAPMILLFAKVERRRHENEGPYVSTTMFLAGYILIWSGFSAAATGVQWGLQSAALISPMMMLTSPILGGLLLIAAGIFQWTPLKYSCLTHCRSPIGFLMSDWKEGTKGALVMGVRHGIYCLGCCWVLMTLLFVLGVMNILWIAALSGFVLLEKVAPAGQLVSRLSGVLLVIWGVWILITR